MTDRESCCPWWPYPLFLAAILAGCGQTKVVASRDTGDGRDGGTHQDDGGTHVDDAASGTGSGGTSAGEDDGAPASMAIWSPGERTDAGGTLGPWTVTPLPPRPPWEPPFTQGVAGWRGSGAPFCSEIVASLHASVWSTNDAVYVLVTTDCPNLDVNFTCNGAGEASTSLTMTLYENDGKTGWRALYRALRDDGQRIAGSFNGSIAILGGSAECSVLLVDPDGAGTCIAGPTADFYPTQARGLVTDDGDLLMLGNPGDSSKTSLVKYDGVAWTTLHTWSGQQVWGLAANGPDVVVAGPGQFVWTGSTKTGSFAPVPEVPAGDYYKVAAGPGGELFLGDVIGRLTVYADAKWSTVETGFTHGISGMWRAPDDTVFVVSGASLGTWKSGAYTTVTSTAATPSMGTSGFVGFDDIWGNSSTEVFLVGLDTTLFDTTCGADLLFWYDGVALHEF